MPYFNRAQLMKFAQALELGGVKEGDMLVEIGESSFSGDYTDATDMPLPTQLNQIKFGLAVPFDSYSPATDADLAKAYQLFVAPDVAEDTDSHRKTFSVHRSSDGAISGLNFCYILVGRHWDTSA